MGGVFPLGVAAHSVSAELHSTNAEAKRQSIQSGSEPERMQRESRPLFWKRTHSAERFTPPALINDSKRQK